jgi:hypothetical protein
LNIQILAFQKSPRNFFYGSTQYILSKSRISAVANWHSFVQLLLQFTFAMKKKAKKLPM